MKWRLLSIGKWGNLGEKELFAVYAKRCRPALLLQEISLKSAKEEQAKAGEGKLILSALKEGELVVALDEHGKEITSLDFAQEMARWRSSGRDVAFVIGGATGLAPEVVKKADFVLSLSKLTLPHLMARVVLAEQLYRAECILQHHPYHK